MLHFSYLGIKSWNHSNANIILQTTYSHIPNKQLDDANKQSSSNSTKHERRTPEDGQTIVTETCRVLMMCFADFLKPFSVLNVNVF